jgi:hypothetical protein
MSLLEEVQVKLKNSYPLKKLTVSNLNFREYFQQPTAIKPNGWSHDWNFSDCDSAEFIHIYLDRSQFSVSWM